ncbi:hypothetical protein OROHE_019185 [Orobanche hederae]
MIRGWVVAGMSFEGWLQQVFSNKDKSDIEIVICILWAVWKGRNNCCWEGKGFVPAQIWLMAKHVLRDWTVAIHDARQPTIVAPVVSIGTVGRWRCRVDAALFPGTMMVGYEVVLWTADGDFAAATNGQINCIQDPLLAEVMATRKALSWLKEKNITEVALESDCLHVVQMILQKKEVHACEGGEEGCGFFYEQSAFCILTLWVRDHLGYWTFKTTTCYTGLLIILRYVYYRQ